MKTDRDVGPVLSASWADRDRFRDLTIIILVGCVGALALAALGLPPVNLHMPQHFIGIMDPMCGMTRATRLFARGDVPGAIRYNPASLLLGTFAAVMIARAAIGVTTRKWLDITVRRTTAIQVTFWVLFAALWINQQAHAALLMRST